MFAVTDCGLSPDQLLFSGRQGDGWGQELTRTVGVSPIDPGSLLVQIRRGPRRTGRLIASSGAAGAAPGVLQIVLTGTDLTADPALIVWAITADTSGVVVGSSYWIEFEVQRSGVSDTIIRHQWLVCAETAVR